ncbi:MAG TPA: phospholipase D-like domain-containing protein [Gaiellaceae bacterium]|nr:phospholipase D-like domain-containing protein [Gaiellaceae bacterium]
MSLTSDSERKAALRFVSEPVSRQDLGLAFAESRATSVDVHVEGRNFYRPMLEDIRAATSSIHINQFGFRPGAVGDAFADALVAKATEGIPVRLVVDRQGSKPEEDSRALYERLNAADIEVCVIRATKPRAAVGPLGRDGATRWNLAALGHIDHRKVVIVDGRIGWIGGAGIEDRFQDGRFHDLFLRAAGPVVAQLQLVFLASFRWLGGAIPPCGDRDALPVVRCRAGRRSRRRPSQRAGPLPANHRRNSASARPSGSVGGRRVSVRRAVQLAGRGSLGSWATADRDEGAGQGNGVRRPLAVALMGSKASSVESRS